MKKLLIAALLLGSPAFAQTESATATPAPAAAGTPAAAEFELTDDQAMIRIVNVCKGDWLVKASGNAKLEQPAFGSVGSYITTNAGEVSYRLVPAQPEGAEPVAVLTMRMLAGKYTLLMLNDADGKPALRVFSDYLPDLKEGESAIRILNCTSSEQIGYRIGTGALKGPSYQFRPGAYVVEPSTLTEIELVDAAGKPVAPPLDLTLKPSEGVTLFSFKAPDSESIALLPLLDGSRPKIRPSTRKTVEAKLEPEAAPAKQRPRLRPAAPSGK